MYRLGAAIALDVWTRFLSPFLHPYTSSPSPRTATPPPALVSGSGSGKGGVVAASGAAPSLLGAMHGVLFFLLRGLQSMGGAEEGAGDGRRYGAKTFAAATIDKDEAGGGEGVGGEEVWPLVEDRYCYEAVARLEAQVPIEWAVRSHMALLQVLALQAATDAWGEVHPQVGRRDACTDDAYHVVRNHNCKASVLN